MTWHFWQWKRRNDELDAEIAHDLALDAEERIRAGIPRIEAETASRRDFGNVVLLKEDVRGMWGWTTAQQLVQDVRYGWRTLRQDTLFTSMAVLSLALGIGANTAIFSVMDAIMLRALPVRNPGELVILNWSSKQPPQVAARLSGNSYDEPGGGMASPNFPWPAYKLLRDHNNVVSTLFAYTSPQPLNLVVRGQAEVGQVQTVSGNFFSGLGIIPAAGRLLADSDDRADASRVVVLSNGYWRDRLAADPAAIGQTISINDVPFTIAGVAAPEFFGVTPGSAPLVYVPMVNRLSLERGDESRTFIDERYYWTEMMGRLRPGVTLAAAQVELAARFHQFALSTATNDKERNTLPVLRLQEGGSGIDSLRRQYSKPLFVLMTMVAFILVIACANIANLLLARAVKRRREMAVRLSLGASRLRVLRQLLTESVMLALPGGILGVGIAAAGIGFLLWLLSGGSDSFSLRASLDWRVLAFTIAVALATGIVFGLAPAIAATRVDITPALKETRASTPRKRGRPLGLSQILVISQIALSLLLVLGAAVFVRTLANLHAVQIGFNQENLLTFQLDPSQAGYRGAALKSFYARMDERFRVLPGVRATTETDMPLVSNYMSGTNVVLPGAPKGEGRDGPGVDFVSVGPTFFETMQLPLVLGRSLNAHDVDGALPVVVVNEIFAKTYFSNQNPIGRQFKLGNGAPNFLTIVGVAKNARYNSLKREIPPVAYLPYLQNTDKDPQFAMTFELRAAGDPLALAETVRKTVHEAAPRVPVTNVATQTHLIENTITQERTFADLCTAFAILALVIACVGLYGTMAYAVSRRTNEIGIRLALGAERRRIIWMVLREVLALAAVGVAIGLACAWSAMSAIESFVFGMKPADPLAILTATAILVIALLLAGFAPATRASRIDPLAALRHE